MIWGLFPKNPVFDKGLGIFIPNAETCFIGLEKVFHLNIAGDEMVIAGLIGQAHVATDPGWAIPGHFSHISNALVGIFEVIEGETNGRNEIRNGIERSGGT